MSTQLQELAPVVCSQIMDICTHGALWSGPVRHFWSHLCAHWRADTPSCSAHGVEFTCPCHA